jgi:hypothetical protein
LVGKHSESCVAITVAVTTTRKLIEKLTQPEYARLRALTNEAPLDAEGLQSSLQAFVTDRLELAHGLLRAAGVLLMNDDPLVRRSAASRAYYGAYHAARAAVFAVHRRDVDDHERLAEAVDGRFPGEPGTGELLKQLRRLRSEVDYSPYPGPGSNREYETQELETQIRDCVTRAQQLVRDLEERLRRRG